MSQNLKIALSHPRLLTPELANAIAAEIMAGKLTSAQISGFLVALKLLELEASPPYIVAVATAMKDASVSVQTSHILIDIVGTGGDGQDTFNVSTASSIVAAGAGCKVAKHGNRASSSSCGSADVLEELGCRLDKIDSQKATNILNSGNFCFLFAQLYHPAMKYVAGPRKELGVRTIFNILGPLTNPASPRRMIVGVYSKDLGFIMAESLKLLKIEKAWVVCGEVGLDEISPQGKTFVWELSSNDDKIIEKTISPADFGLPEHSLKSVKGGSAADNAKIMNQLLDGKLQGPMLDFVLLNTAALLYVSDMGDSLTTCVNLARESISNGSARKAFDHFLLKSNQ